MKKSVLVLGASENMLFAVGCFLISLKKYNSNLTEDILIFYDKITEEEKRKFACFNNVTLIQYRCPFKDTNSFSYFMKDLYTLMVFSKFECFRLLKQYETVIWMDYDMFILDDISELLIPTKEGVKAIVTKTISDSLLESKFCSKYNHINGIHSSIFVLDSNLKNPEAIYKYCLEKTIELKDYLKCPEQAILALAFSHFDIAVYPLDFRIYSNLFLEKNLYDRYVKIYHTYGPSKFWNDLNYEPWNHCFEEWKQL